jgi:2-keto-4-pentenoate hydratase/2-oxohepta-3-ene-1,7-dioic acid hydratase in catechol pathway
VNFVRFDDGITGIVVTGAEAAFVVDVGQSLDAFGQADPEAAALIRFALGEDPRGPWTTLIDEWPTVGPAFDAMSAWASAPNRPAVTHDVSSVELRPPLSALDVAVFAAGANFAQHAARASSRGAANEAEVVTRMRALIDAKAAGTPPWGFSILPRTIIGPDAKTALPIDADKLDYECEVAIVIRVDDGAITPWAVVPWNDLSIRGQYFQRGHRVDEGPLTWSLQKNFDGGSACGPWLVVEPNLDVNDLDVRTRVNGELRQEGNTSEMVYSYDELITHVSNFVTLRSGDVIVSGTPAGTAIEQGADGPFLRPGDVVEVEVAAVGVLRNRVGEAGSATPKWAGARRPTVVA